MYKDFDDEATIYQNASNNSCQTAVEQSFAENHVNETESSASNNKAKKNNNGNKWKSIGIGAASAVLIGGAATLLTGMKPFDGDSSDTPDDQARPDWADSDVSIATSVDDGMTFDEAFAAARAEVGSGGCFEWHGNVYSTYTAEEWDNMTPQEKAEYGDHFNWNHLDNNSSDVANHTAEQVVEADNSDDVASNAIIDGETSHDVASENQEPVSSDQADSSDIMGIVMDENHDVEILGVIHDETSGQNIGTMAVDGQEVVLIDVDGDMEFDYMATDFNENGQYEANEVIDIQADGLTVDDFGGFSNVSDDVYASTIDVSTDDPMGHSDITYVDDPILNDDFSGQNDLLTMNDPLGTDGLYGADDINLTHDDFLDMSSDALI